MSFASQARANSKETNKQPLVKAVAVNLLDTGYYEIVGECGHRLTCVRKREAEDWENRIVTATRCKKRCWHCAQ